MTESTENTSPEPKSEEAPSPEEWSRLRAENAQLIATIRDLTHSQLISRDVELGLRAEIMQAHIQLVHAHAVGAAEVQKVRRSMTWRVGRAITKPVGVVRALGRRFR